VNDVELGALQPADLPGVAVDARPRRPFLGDVALAVDDLLGLYGVGVRVLLA
jgi:hypothetical protein